MMMTDENQSRQKSHHQRRRRKGNATTQPSNDANLNESQQDTEADQAEAIAQFDRTGHTVKRNQSPGCFQFGNNLWRQS